VNDSAASPKVSGTAGLAPSVWAGRTITMAVILSCFLMAMQPIRSADVWHHVKSGWLVEQNGGPARAEVFSCTAQGKRWIQYEWLSQYLIHRAHEAGGVAGLLLFRAVGVAAAAALLLLACRGRGAGWVASGVAVVLAMCCGSGRFFSRPEIFTLVILAGTMACFERMRLGRGKLWILPAILMIPWVNMHGAWVAGLAYMGLVCAGDSAPLLRGGGSPTQKRTWAFLWIALGLATVATMANPFGAHIWEVPFKLSKSPIVREVIAEWKRPDAAHWLKFRHLGVLLFLGALLAAPRRITLTDGMIIVFFGALSLTARRHLALAMLVTAPIFARQMGFVWEQPWWPAGIKKALGGRWRIATPILICVMAVIVALGGAGLPKAGVGIDKTKYPIGAARFMSENALDGNIFNSYAFGNYLLFARYQQNHVFIDGRVDMYGGEIVELYDEVRTAGEGWQQALKDYSVETCVIETSRETDSALLAQLEKSPDWALVYWDDISAIYVERSEKHAAFLEQAYVFAVPPDTPNPPMLRTPEGLARAEMDYRKTLERDPDCVLALWGMAECLRRRGMLDDAITALERAVELAPDVAMLNFNLGACLLQTGRPNEAEGYLKLSARQAGRGENPNPMLRTMALWNLSIVHENQGRLDKAISLMEEVVRLQPVRAGAAERLRNLHVKANQTESP